MTSESPEQKYSIYNYDALGSQNSKHVRTCIEGIEDWLNLNFEEQFDADTFGVFAFKLNFLLSLAKQKQGFVKDEKARELKREYLQLRTQTRDLIVEGDKGEINLVLLGFQALAEEFLMYFYQPQPLNENEVDEDEEFQDMAVGSGLASILKNLTNVSDGVSLFVRQLLKRRSQGK